MTTTTTTTTTTTDGSVASPCTGVCRIDPTSGWCEGCRRTLDEIAAWAVLDAGARRAIVAALPLRRRHPDAGGTAPPDRSP